MRRWKRIKYGDVFQSPRDKISFLLSRLLGNFVKLIKCLRHLTQFFLLVKTRINGPRLDFVNSYSRLKFLTDFTTKSRGSIYCMYGVLLCVIAITPAVIVIIKKNYFLGGSIALSPNCCLSWGQFCLNHMAYKNTYPSETNAASDQFVMPQICLTTNKQ